MSRNFHRFAFAWAIVMILLLALQASMVRASERPADSFDMSGTPVNVVLGLYFKEVYAQPYVLCDAVLTDSRLVSVRAAGDSLDAAAMGALLSAYGYEAVNRDGILTVCKKSEDGKPAAVSVPFVYVPRYRQVSYLVDLLSPMFTGTFANRRSANRGAFAVGDNAGAAVAGQSSGPQLAYNASDRDDVLLYSGSEADIKRLQGILAQVDQPLGEVVVKAHVYEVGSNARKASSLDVLSMIGEFFKGKFEVSLDAAGGGHTLSIRGPNLSAVASLMNTDGRFKLVASPFVRVRSGESAHFQVGDEVPVLGAIVTGNDGSTRQSIEYRPSGTIFEISPHVRAELVDVDLFQQVSSFVATENGVNGSPTLQTRELRTALSVRQGELIVVGGLNDSRETGTRSRLPWVNWPLGKGEDRRQSELVMILEVTRI